jgi:hypothetical protein
MRPNAKTDNRFTSGRQIEGARLARPAGQPPPGEGWLIPPAGTGRRAGHGIACGGAVSGDGILRAKREIPFGLSFGRAAADCFTVPRCECFALFVNPKQASVAGQPDAVASAPRAVTDWARLLVSSSIGCSRFSFCSFVC